jgi:prepilin-type N-terminal cleavage/methylation domain-containing protein
MNAHPQSLARSLAFTLVELLTVIAIIAILMGLLFPAIGIVKEQARKSEAKTACAGIVAAVKAYNTEYGKYPVLDNPTAKDLWFGDTTAGAAKDNADLFNVLRAKVVPAGADYNPRRILFFEGKDAGNPTAPKGGFAATGSSGVVGAFYDPWGTQYNVVIDANYDNVLDELPYTDFKGTTKGPQTGCVVFSLGKDAKLGTNGDRNYKATAGGTPSDDVISWQ